MTEEVVTRQKAQVATPAELAAAREARGMSQVDISHRIKLQIKQVNALEQGRWEALPGRSFVRGALRSYGRLLDVDVAPLLESIGGFAEPSLAPVPGSQPLDATLSRSSGLGFDGGGRGSPLIWVIACLAGVVGLVLYFGSDQDASRFRSWLPSGDTPSEAAADPAPAVPADPLAAGVLSSGAAAADGSSLSGQAAAGSASGLPAGAVAAAGAPTTPAAAGPLPPGPPSPSALGALQVLPNKGSGAGSPPAGGTPAAAGLSPAPAESATAAGPGSSAGVAAPDAAVPVDTRRLIQVKANEDSWVEVRQADGSALHNGLVKAGSSIELKGTHPPYRLVIGNASRLELTYGGKAQNLAPHIRAHNIAKLQLP